MNFTRNKIILYVLIIATGIDFILPWPIYQQKTATNGKVIQSAETRFPRQIVQPTWLNNFQIAPIDPTVHISQRALEEAEEIRKAIQTAVDEGTYAVTEEQTVPNPDSENLPTFAPPDEMNTPFPPHSLPDWYLQMQKLWEKWSQNLFSGFRF